jgi:hypothetical protein
METSVNLAIMKVAFKRTDLRTYLKIAELGELFAAIVETAQVWLRLIVHDLVSTNISTLSEPFSTDLALVWAFSSVSSFVSLWQFMLASKYLFRYRLQHRTFKFPSCEKLRPQPGSLQGCI